MGPSKDDETPDVEDQPKKRVLTREAMDKVQGHETLTQEAIDQAELDQLVNELDAEDMDDPSMCAEYVREIFEYYTELEKTTMPNANYMDHQEDLEWKMRGILIDWLIEVHTRFRLFARDTFPRRQHR